MQEIMSAHGKKAHMNVQCNATHTQYDPDKFIEKGGKNKEKK